MKPRNDVGKLLVGLGAFAWIAGLAACGGKNSRPAPDSGAVSTGGAYAPDAGPSAGRPGGGGTSGSGGLVGSGGVIGSGGVVASGGLVGSGGAVGSGGRTGGGGGTGKADAATADAARACGTAGATCGAGQFCDLASQCDTIPNAEGTCEATGPLVACTKEYRPVCGCDRVAYDNDCLRRAAGVLKLQDGLCGGPPDGSTGGQYGYDGGLGSGGATGTGGAPGSGGTTGTIPSTTYTGCFRIGGIDHVSLQKSDLAQDQCIVLGIAGTSTGRSGYTVTLPNGWALLSASIKPCAGTGTAVVATSATGTITWGAETVYPPATANVDVVLGVALVDGGPTVTYVFLAEDVDLKIGC